MLLACRFDHLRCSSRKLLERMRRQVFLAELNKINSGASGMANAIEHRRTLLRFSARKLLPISYVVEDQDVSGGGPQPTGSGRCSNTCAPNLAAGDRI